MSDIQRVKEMVAEGSITAEEGAQLIRVLEEVDLENQAAAEAAYEAGVEAGDFDPDPPEAAHESGDAEFEFEADVTLGPVEAARQAARLAEDAGRQAASLGAKEARETLRSARDAARETARGARDAAREAARSARDAARTAREAARSQNQFAGYSGAGDDNARPGAAIAPAHTRWVTVEMIAGDLDVWAVDGLEGPEVEGGPGNINVEDSPDGYTVKFAPVSGNALDRILSRVRSGNLKIRIPSDFGLVVRATAGDVDLHGVRYLRGKLTAGNLDADALEGIDFSSMAGDLDVALLLRDGKHVLTVGAGDVEVRLDERSDVTVDAAVSIGDASSPHPAFTHSSQTVGARLNGVLGAGSARLELRATTGDIDVKLGRVKGRSDPATEEGDRV